MWKSLRHVLAVCVLLFCLIARTPDYDSYPLAVQFIRGVAESSLPTETEYHGSRFFGRSIPSPIHPASALWAENFIATI